MKDLLESEKEWRRFLMSEVQDIKKTQNEMLLTMTTLKIKIGAFSSVFGAIGALAITWITKKMGL
jgi:hypothetical protein